MSLAGQYWFSIVSILAWWQVTILNISTGLWWFADRIRGSCELAHWFGFVYIVYIIFCQTSVLTFCRTRMSWAFPRGHDCFKNSYQNLNYPFIAAAHTALLPLSTFIWLHPLLGLQLNLASSLLMITFRVWERAEEKDGTALAWTVWIGKPWKSCLPQMSTIWLWKTGLRNQTRQWAHPPRSLVLNFNLACPCRAQPLPNEQVQIWFLSLFVFFIFRTFSFPARLTQCPINFCQVRLIDFNQDHSLPVRPF